MCNGFLDPTCGRYIQFWSLSFDLDGTNFLPHRPQEDIEFSIPAHLKDTRFKR